MLFSTTMLETEEIVTGTRVLTEDIDPTGMYFKPDGTKFYMIGQQNDKIYQYAVSPAWDINGISFVNSKSISAQDEAPQGVALDSTGTKAYMVGGIGGDINQYALSTAWAITSATFSKLKNVSESPSRLVLSSSGTELYFISPDTSSVYQYTLSTAKDIATMTFTRSTDVSAKQPFPTGMGLSQDGTLLAVVGTEWTIFIYDLLTAWNIGTAVYSYSVSLGANISVVQIAFTEDKLYLFTLSFSPAAELQKYLIP